MSDINVWAILVAAVASMIIGGLWYGPLFGKPFMKAMGMDQWSKEKQEAEKKRMGMLYGLQFVASLVMFYFLAAFIRDTGMTTTMGGMLVALCAWGGFVVPVKFADSLWGGKMILFWLGAGNMLLTLLAAGAILGGWR